MRIYASFTSIAPLHPDEIFRTLEGAHELVFGRGFILPGSEIGVNNWLLPLIIAGFYKILDVSGVRDPLYINIGIKIFFSIFNSLAVSVVYLLFRKHGLGKKTAFLFTVPLSVSYLHSYISVRTIAESAVLPLIVFAICFASDYIEKKEKKYLFFTVLTAGAACIITFQSGISDGFSLLQRDFYLREFAATFHPLTCISAILMMIYAAINFRKNTLLLLFVFPFLFIFAVNPLIAEKHPRFVFACHFAFLALSSEFFAFLYQKFGQKREKAALFLSLFLLFSLDAFPHIKYSTLWNHSADTAGRVLETESELGRIPDLKRAYIFGVSQIQSGGYSYFHKNAPLFFASEPENIKKMMRKAIDLKQSDSYCAFRKDIEIPEEYRKNLEEISSNGDFTIYRLLP